MRETGGTLRVDLHGRNKYQAKVTLDAALRRADGSVYRIAVIHGWHGGTELRDMVRGEYRSHPKVRRIEPGQNPGETLLVLRER